MCGHSIGIGLYRKGNCSGEEETKRGRQKLYYFELYDYKVEFLWFVTHKRHFIAAGYRHHFSPHLHTGNVQSSDFQTGPTVAIFVLLSDNYVRCRSSLNRNTIIKFPKFAYKRSS
jgi:hypothetical protein